MERWSPASPPPPIAPICEELTNDNLILWINYLHYRLLALETRIGSDLEDESESNNTSTKKAVTVSIGTQTEEAIYPIPAEKPVNPVLLTVSGSEQICQIDVDQQFNPLSDDDDDDELDQWRRARNRDAKQDERW